MYKLPAENKQGKCLINKQHNQYLSKIEKRSTEILKFHKKDVYISNL